MSFSSLQSRSSIDLRLSKPQTPIVSNQLTRPHPPRLQHSPSLPNIWFPPHSGPLPIDMSLATRDSQSSLNRPPTPSPPASHPPPKTPQMPFTKSHSCGIAPALEKLSLKDNDARRTPVKTMPLHTRKRQRKDREAAHHLLTPPLTPSSSIRTTASTESADGKHTDKAEMLHALQEPEATRFLYLENVSRTSSLLTLQGAISDALAHISSRRASKSSLATGVTDDKGNNASCIKGFFLRHIETTGTLFLAFHDVRDALAAKVILSQRTDGLLAEYLGEENSTDGMPAWFRCRFIAAEELVKTIGNSNFLATTDGGFTFSVTAIELPDSEGPQPHGSSEPKPGIEAHILIQILEAYGDLRLFKSEHQENERERTFHVEFFDVRDASEAYTYLNDQTMFGMKLTTSGRVTSDSRVSDNHGCAFPGRPGQHRSDTPQSSHQPSASESHIPRLKSGIGAAGEASQMRGRFVNKATKSRPRAVSVGNETTSSPSPTQFLSNQLNAPSPTVFYTSFDFHDPYSDVPRPSYGRPISEQTLGCIENCGETYEPTGGQVKSWEPQQTCSIVDCRYCPSKGYDSSLVQPQFINQVNPPFATPIPFPVQSPSPIFVGPSEYEGHGLFPVANWSFDPNAITPNVTANIDMFSPTFVSAIPVVPVEHRFPEQNVGFVPSGLVYPVIPSPAHVRSQPFIEQRPVPALDQNIFVNNSTEASQNLDTGLGVSTSTLGINERNILNIARIEEGLDTRTTVMIKNIPNKMSANDLIQYINKVCPRAIDFLYLRMDFKNGCNVGYAFVNFIRVEDMLHFAKERLNVKWNMFSSEKVLQMSYANYQGKEALVEKFKNSCIMDEREEWRPKIFFSSGEDQGMPEPFPAPTHLRRKERSSHNKGALYVPGITSGPINGGSIYLTNGPMRRHDYDPTLGSKYLEHRSRHVDRNRDTEYSQGGGGRRGRASWERPR